ncbi:MULTISPECIES: telomere-binding protein [Rhodococcus]|nr:MULTISPECIES: telomere-binding protein [Rhodococcus]MCZ4570233.1 telomere-binding protein [Rhodococcus erythropolis]
MMTSPAHRGHMWSMENIRGLLESAGGMKVRSSTQLSARCPVHDDGNASLSVTWTDDGAGGKVLLKCHGCGASAQDIADALGMSTGDLFDEPLPPRSSATPLTGRSTQQRTAGRRRGKLGALPKTLLTKAASPEIEHAWVPVATYPYVDAEGSLVQEVVREECTNCELGRHKQFRQVFVSASGRRVKQKPRDFQSVLYRTPQLLAAISAGTPVWLVEGEKDVETAEQIGLVATTNAQGGRSFPAECAAVFENATVRVVLDRDDAGWDRGIDLASMLGGVGAHVQLLLPATLEPKSDFTDHVLAGKWSGDDEFGGFVPVTAGEVAAHAYAGAVRGKHLLVEKAAAEADAHVASISDARDSQLPFKRAKRWALESELRFEILSEAVDRCRLQAATAGSEWAGQAADEAVAAWRLARNAARGAHEIAQIPIPPLLQDPDLHNEVAATQEEAAGSESRSALVLETGVSAAPGGSTVQRGSAISAPTYRIVDMQLVEITTTKDGEESAKLVLGLDARIVEMEYLEAQDESFDIDLPKLMGREGIVGQKEANPPAPKQLSAVIIGYTHPDTGEFMRLRIAALDYRDCGWVESLPGPPAYDSRPSGIAKLRDALKVAGGTITRTVRFRSTGWRRTAEGEWFFVHAGGAISGEGARVAPVLLSGPLARYDLPAPIRDAERIREAFLAHSGSMLTQFPSRVSATLLGHVYRSALGPNPWVLLIVGSPGSYKTSLTSIAMHHWGELWDRRRPASSMSGNGDTLNALRIKLNSAKDALYWADDVAPTRDWGAAQKSLEEFARMVHNGESRSRATRDGLGILDGTPPRASAVVTSEVMPRPGSGAQRMLAVPLQADEIELDHLIALDRDESRHGRALLMASFLQYLAGHLEEIRELASQAAAHYAESLRSSGESVRQAEAVGAIWGGWVAMTRFLLDVGALTEQEVDQNLEVVHLGLRDAITAAADPDLPSRTGARVRELIAHALRTGLAYVDDVRTGEAPAFPLANRLGWRRTLVGEFQDVKKYREDARGIRLGYVLTDPTPRDGEAQLLVESTALEQVLKAAAQSMSDAPQIDRGTALRALYDEGILIGEERAGKTPRYTVQRTIHCEDRRQRLTALRLWKVLGDGDDESHGTRPSDSDDTGPSGSDNTINPGSGGEPIDESPTPYPWQIHRLSHVSATAKSSRGHDLQSSVLDHTQNLSVSAVPEEEPVTSYDDAEGYRAVAEPIYPAAPCSMCGLASPFAFEKRPMHIECWIDSTSKTRAALRVSSPDSDDAVKNVSPLSANSLPSDRSGGGASAEVTESPAVGRHRTTTNRAADRRHYAGPAGVLDVDGLWLPSGEVVDPGPIFHVGHIAEVIRAQNFGTAVNERWSEPGQIWVTDAMARQFGIETGALGDDPRKRAEEMRALTAGLPFVTEALEEGWSLGGKFGDRLGTWTRVWHGDERGVWVAFISAMGQDELDMPILADDPPPVVLASRLATFADALKFPWAMSASTTGFDLMISTRSRERDTVFAPSQPVPPSQMSNTETDIDWSRPLTADESRNLFIHAYDRGGSHAAGIASLELGIGDPQHHESGAIFDKSLPGYWKIEIPESSDWRYPNPLNPRGLSINEPKWVTTPTMQYALELGYEPEVFEAYVWNEHGRVLDPWYKRIRDARTALDLDDPDAQLARDQLKVVYTRTLGMLGSSDFMKGRAGYAPERRHHIIAKARANILRRVVKIGRASDRWPVAISNDTVLYVSDNPDPIASWPGEQETLGRGFGQYKWEGSALLADQVEFLTGKGYRGKDQLHLDWNSADYTVGGDQ